MRTCIRITLVALLASCLVAFHVSLTWAQETPTVGTTPQAAQVPAAPSDFQVDLGQGLVSWADNSTNEEGFRITLSTQAPGGAELYREDHTTGPNVTAIYATSVEKINTGSGLEISVTAFNSFGSSEPAVRAISLESALIPPTPIAVPTPLAQQLPGTGAGSAARVGSNASRAFPLAGILFASLFAVGLAAATHAVKRSQGRH